MDKIHLVIDRDRMAARKIKPNTALPYIKMASIRSQSGEFSIKTARGKENTPAAIHLYDRSAEEELKAVAERALKAGLKSVFIAGSSFFSISTKEIIKIVSIVLNCFDVHPKIKTFLAQGGEWSLYIGQPLVMNYRVVGVEMVAPGESVRSLRLFEDNPERMSDVLLEMPKPKFHPTDKQRTIFKIHLWVGPSILKGNYTKHLDKAFSLIEKEETALPKIAGQLLDRAFTELGLTPLPPNRSRTKN